MPWPVLLLVRELGIGGCERDLTKVAVRLDRARFEPHVGCFHPDGLRKEELERCGVPIMRFPVTSFASASAARGAWQLRAYIRRHGIRLVHCYDVPMDIFGVPVARACGVPAVASQLSYRDLAPARFRRLLRIVDQLSDAVLVNCRAVRDDLAARYGVPAGRTYLCYNGVDTAVFHPVPGASPAPPAGAPLVVGTVCALRPEKNIPLLVEAFARVAPLAPGARLLVVGSGPTLDECRAAAERLKIGDACIFEPARSDVAGYMRAMDIFVLPSASESFSNALLEAMACGCCPVGSRVGGTPELITDGETGLLFEPGHAAGLARKLEILIADPRLRASLGSAAARFARERLSIETAVARMEALYAALIDGHALTATA